MGSRKRTPGCGGSRPRELKASQEEADDTSVATDCYRFISAAQLACGRGGPPKNGRRCAEFTAAAIRVARISFLGTGAPFDIERENLFEAVEDAVTEECSTRCHVTAFNLPMLPGLAARDAALKSAGALPMGDLTNALSL